MAGHPICRHSLSSRWFLDFLLFSVIIGWAWDGGVRARFGISDFHYYYYNLALIPMVLLELENSELTQDGAAKVLGNRHTPVDDDGKVLIMSIYVELRNTKLATTSSMYTTDIFVRE